LSILLSHILELFAGIVETFGHPPDKGTYRYDKCDEQNQEKLQDKHGY
jgi:hypothetical protein